MALNLYYLICILLHLIGFITITVLIPLLNFINYDFKIVITYIPLGEKTRYPISSYYIDTSDEPETLNYIETLDSSEYNESSDLEQKNIPEICYPDNKSEDDEPNDNKSDDEPNDNKSDDEYNNNKSDDYEYNNNKSDDEQENENIKKICETDTEDESETEKKLVKNKKINSILKYIRKIKKS